MEELCTRKCKSRKHAAEVFKAIPKHWESDDQQLKLLSSCYNVGTNRDTSGRTALQLAASFGKVKLIEWVLMKRSQLSSKDDESGYSALHRALFYGQLHAARTLLRHQASLFQPLDNDKLSPLDHLIHDRLTWQNPTSSSQTSEVFVWGSNANYNLGLDNQKITKIPELLDPFEDCGRGVQQISLDKYHTVFLTDLGQAYSCGLGKGGKLGHDSEFTSISPKRICLDLESFPNNRAEVTDARLTSVAVGLNHTLLLANNGRVWSCGMNQYGQLGLSSAPTQALLPKCLPVFIDKNKMMCPIRGISASRFHSVFWTSESVFSCGLNAGALGHGKGEKMIAIPKQVTALSDLEGNITMVACSDGATAIATSKGDVFVLHEYQCRKIASKQPEFRKIGMIGGNLDPIHEDVTNQNSELQVVILTMCGRILLWSQTNPSLTRAVFVGGPQLLVKDMAFSRSCIALVSSFGEAFTGTIVHPGEKLKAGNVTSFQPASSKEGLARWRANAHVKITRIPSISRAIGIECDPEGKNFAIIQAHPYNEFKKKPDVEPSVLAANMKELLDVTDEMDCLHDIIFRFGTNNIAAHRFVIYSNARRFYEDFCTSTLITEDHNDANHAIDISEISEEVFQLLLEFIYTGSCEFLDPQSRFWNPCSSWTRNSSRNLFNGEDEDNEKDTSRFELLKDLQQSAKKLKIDSMERLLDKVRIGINNTLVMERLPSPCKSFSRFHGEEFYDTRITCEDGVEFDAHRAILSARVEYFRGMFSFGWMESSKVATVKLPVPSSVFRVVLDYIYEDRATEIEKSRDVTWIMECLVVADQLLITRLVSICELALAQLLTLKNVGQLLEFSSMYNASQLKTSCMDFICCNLPAIVELRLWEALSEEVMDDLTQFYQQSNGVLIDRCSTLASAIAAAEDAFASYEIPHNVSLNRSDSSSPRKQDAKRGKSRRKANRKTSESKEVQFSAAAVEYHDTHLTESFPEPIPIELAPKNTDWVKVDKQRKRNKSESAEQSKDTYQTPSAVGVATPTRERTKSTGNRENEKTTDEASERSTKQATLFDLATVTQLKSASSPDSPKTAKTFRKVSQRQRKQLEGKLKEAGPITSPPNDSSPSTASKQNPWAKSVSSPLEVKSAWKSVPNVEAEPIQSKAKFAEKEITSPMKSIIADEEEKKRNLDRAKSKPLSLTLLEDRAIEELEKFYNVHGVFDEYIVVERVVPTALAVPVWSVPRSSEQSQRRTRLSSTTGN